MQSCYGMWRSWLAHHVRDVGVVCSSQIIPTEFQKSFCNRRGSFLFPVVNHSLPRPTPSLQPPLLACASLPFCKPFPTMSQARPLAFASAFFLCGFPHPPVREHFCPFPTPVHLGPSIYINGFGLTLPSIASPSSPPSTTLAPPLPHHLQPLVLTTSSDPSFHMLFSSRLIAIFTGRDFSNLRADFCHFVDF